MKIKNWQLFIAVIVMGLAFAVAPVEASGTHNDAASDKDIVDTAISAGSFTTLVKAVQAAGLVDALRSEGPFTIFAPTDEAFAKLPAGTLDTLLADKEKLAAVLTYHVVPGRLTASDVITKSELATLQGQDLKVSVGESAMVDQAKIVKTDIVCSNGVIHVIDSVVVPH